jgi:putative addiction module component (TIGR02574 family)
VGVKDVAAKILDEALRLPPEARAAIADSLFDSLDVMVDPDAEDAWQREIRERITNLDSGATKTVPWAEARKTILGG